MRTVAIAIMGVLMTGSGFCQWTQLGSDIDGEGAGDNSGSAVSLSSDGTIVAIGALYNAGNGDLSGHVRIYQWNGAAWNQLGQDIDGEGAWDNSGSAVSLSSDGSIVAIGAPNSHGNGDLSGHVRIYQWNGAAWNQLGSDIDGEAEGNYSGESISLSSDGTIVAIGAPGNDGNGAYSGHVRIFQWDGAAWNQLGSDIDGEAEENYSGESVSLSSDGTIVAIGAPENDENGAYSGHVRIYQWDDAQWIQLGDDIDGEATWDFSGESVSLSSDGTIVAIGAPNNSYGNGAYFGHVRIYQWDGAAWIQRGDDIDGEAEEDGSGEPVSLSSDGTIVAIGAPNSHGNGENSGHVRIYQWDGAAWNQLGNDIDGEAEENYSGKSVSLSSDGTIVAIGAPENDGNGVFSGHVRIYQFHPDSDEDGISDDDDQCPDTPAGQTVNSNGCDTLQLLDQVNQQLQDQIASLQVQVTGLQTLLDSSYVLHLEAGWNLVSLGKDPQAFSVTDILGDAHSGAVWTWQDGRFQTTTTMQSQKGYWIYAVEQAEIEVQLP